MSLFGVVNWIPLHKITLDVFYLNLFFFLFQSDIKSIFSEWWYGYVCGGKKLPTYDAQKSYNKSKKKLETKNIFLSYIVLCRYTWRYIRFGCEFCFFYRWKFHAVKNVRWVWCTMNEWYKSIRYRSISYVRYNVHFIWTARIFVYFLNLARLGLYMNYSLVRLWSWW